MGYITKEEIIRILHQHETATYPNGVGSIEFSITPDSYGDIASSIISTINARYDG